MASQEKMLCSRIYFSSFDDNKTRQRKITKRNSNVICTSFEISRSCQWPEDDQCNPSGQLFSSKIQASVSQSELAATAYNHHHHLVHPRRKAEEEEQDTDCSSTAFFVQTGFRIISTNQRPNYVCALESCVRNGLILASIDLLSDVMMVLRFITLGLSQASIV